MRFPWVAVFCALPALFALAAASPARAGGLPIPLFSEPFSVEYGLGPPGVSAGIVAPQFLQVVFDGALYWVLYRSGIEPLPNGNALLAVRVDEDGSVLDPHGLFIGPYAESPYHAITAAPWGALVTYAAGSDVFMMRLGRDGALADPAPTALGVGTRSFPYPGAACLDDGCLAIWSTPSETHAVALDACGAILPETERQLPYGHWEPRAAGDGYLLVDADNSSTLPLQALGLAADGQTRWGPVTLPFPPGNGHAFAVGPAGALFVWLDVSRALWALRLDASGTQSGTPQPVPLTDVSDIGNLTAEGDHFRLALHRAAAAAVLRLDAAGLPLDSEPLTVAEDDACAASGAVVASGSRTALVTWERSPSSPGCVEVPPSAALVGFGSSPAVTPVDVTAAVARMGAPALASDGKRYLAAWFEERAGATGLYTQALDLTGAPLETPVLTIAAPLQQNDLRPAFASFLAGHYVVELGKNDGTADANRAADIDAATLARGAPREQTKLGVPGRTSFLDVELEITQHGEDLGRLARIRTRATDATSTAIGNSWIHELPSGTSDGSPVVGFDGQSFALVWSYESDDGSGQAEPELLFMRFDETGTPLLSEPLLLPGLGAFVPQALTFGSDSYLLTLASGSSDLGTPLSGVSIDASGTLRDAAPHPFSVPAPGHQLRFSAATFDGTAFEIAWSERFFPAPSGAPSTDRVDPDLHVAWVAPDGTPLAEAAVANSQENEQSGALASAGDAHALFAYSRFDRDPQYLSTRAFVRQLGSGTCSTDQTCTDSTCSDCCLAGCARAAAALTCGVATCDTGCAEAEHCVAGLGCVPNPPSPAANPHLAKGCSCRYPTADPDGRSSLLLAASLAALALTRLRRQIPGRR